MYVKRLIPILILADVESSTSDAEGKEGCESEDVRQGELIEATLSYYQQSCVLAVSTVTSSSQYHHHQYQVGCIITCETMNQVEANVNHVCFMLVDVFE